MTPDAPEFHTETLSPLSPLPLYPPEPSNIPVLRNQTDPVFNMTSTHLDPAESYHPSPIESKDTAVEEATTPPEDDATSVDSNFSDAYKEEPSNNDTMKDTNGGGQGDDVSDDYAMTFDSDGEERTDSQDVTQANIVPETKSLPVNPSDSAADLPTAVPDIASADVPQVGPNNPQVLSSHSPIQPTTDAPSAILPSSDATEDANEPAMPHTHTYEEIANGDIDIQQLLDNITANAEKNEAKAAANLPPPLPIGLPVHASLPPRPNIPQKRALNDDIQKYHAASPSITQNPSSFRPSNVALIAAGAPGTSTDAPRGGLPPPPSASFRASSISSAGPISPTSNAPMIRNSAGNDHQTKSIASQDDSEEVDVKWGPEVQKLYDDFLEYERENVTEGAWDRFPAGSRLFIGNLPSEKVTKRDLFHVFHHYGKLAQISIKQAFGFVQFHDKAACSAALAREQGAEVRGRRMHLEVCKPTKNNRAERGVQPPKRSRSPEFNRGSAADRGNRQGQAHFGRAPPAMRQDEYGRPLRVRDDYRPPRQATPPSRGGYRGREEYAPRGRDAYEPGHDRRRSRSPPYGFAEPGRYRERSLSPRRREANEDAELQIARRDPRNVPDVQIILMDPLDRSFVSWVENEILARGLRVEVMFLSPRLPLQAVIRRQILEGVHAVSKLDMRSQNSSKISLQVFDRQGGADNVRFDEYQDLEPRIAAELVLRAKSSPAAQPPAQSYGQPQYPTNQSYQPPAPQASAPDLASLVGQIDNATLQKLLSTLNAPQQQHNTPAVAANSNIDLAGFLNGLKQQPPPQQNYQQNYQAPPPVSYAGNPALASILGNTAPQPTQNQPQQSAQQVQNIMAQLARFRQ